MGDQMRSDLTSEAIWGQNQGHDISFKGRRKEGGNWIKKCRKDKNHQHATSYAKIDLASEHSKLRPTSHITTQVMWWGQSRSIDRERQRERERERERETGGGGQGGREQLDAAFF